MAASKQVSTAGTQSRRDTYRAAEMEFWMGPAKGLSNRTDRAAGTGLAKASAKQAVIAETQSRRDTCWVMAKVLWKARAKVHDS